jgi:outer membrane protein assembly factor BamD
VAHAILDSYKTALNPGAAKAEAKPATPGTAPAPQPNATPGQPASTASGAPPTLSDVPASGTSNAGAPSEVTPASPAASSPGGTGLGVEVLTPGVNTSSGAASPLPSATGTSDPNLGLKAAGPKDTSPVPAVEAPAPAPDQVNDVAGTKQPPAEAKPAGQKKNPKPAYDKGDESSSTHKKKKGLDKLNPF